MEKSMFNILVICWMITACIIFLVLLFVTAPYGRHTNKKWGLTVPNRLGWILMETPSLVIFLYFFLTGQAEKSMASWTMVILYSAHYINRSLIYPLRIKTSGKQMPVLIMLMAVMFNAVNSSLNGYYIGTLQTDYQTAWLLHPLSVAGILLFLAGMDINMNADEKLIYLRKNITNEYTIPYGGLFNKISCPNFFGEIIEWGGFALLCRSLPALSFFIWTAANLIPRALDHHRWYKKQFKEYPVERKAVLPYLL